MLVEFTIPKVYLNISFHLDVDECDLGLHRCSQGFHCLNVRGSYICRKNHTTLKCPNGYVQYDTYCRGNSRPTLQEVLLSRLCLLNVDWNTFVSVISFGIGFTQTSQKLNFAKVPLFFWRPHVTSWYMGGIIKVVNFARNLLWSFLQLFSFPISTKRLACFYKIVLAPLNTQAKEKMPKS